METEANNPILPDEIIIDILKRLPVKSLIRFQSVCKDWKNLFKTQSFITDHLRHSDHNRPFLVLQRYRGIFNSLHIYLLNNEMEILQIYKPPLVDFSGGVKIVGFSNGLLCGVKWDALLLSNPAIREFRYVPRPIKYDRGIQIFGFGFSLILNDYKILRLCCDPFMRVVRVEVYSLSTGSWKEVEFGVIKSVRHALETTRVTVIVTANGFMFWLGEKDGRVTVVSFDIAMEVFELIPIPNLTSQRRHNTILSVYENKLALVLSCYTFRRDHGFAKFHSSFLELWVMEEGTPPSSKSWSWSKKYSVRTSSKLFPLCIWRSEIIVQEFTPEQLFFQEGMVSKGRFKSLYMLNLTTNELKKLPSFLDSHDNGIWNYAESLVSVAAPTTRPSNCLALRFLHSHCISTLFQHFMWSIYHH